MLCDVDTDTYVTEQVLGGLLTSFEFKTNGIAGIAVDIGNPGESLQRFSLVSSAAAIAGQGPSRYLGSLGPSTIAFVYLAFALLVPLALLVIAAVQWLLPVTLHTQKRLEMWREALSNWSALEVFVSSIGVALLEIGMVSGFIVGRNCNAVKKWLGDFVTYGLLDEQDNTCFLIEANACSGMVVLALASFVTMVTLRTVNMLNMDAMYDRKHRSAPATSVGRSSTSAGFTSDGGDSDTGGDDRYQISKSTRLVHCSLLGSGFIHTWDKSWDRDFFGTSGLDIFGESDQPEQTLPPLSLDFFSSAPTSHTGLQPTRDSPRDRDDRSPAACAQRAVALDAAGSHHEAATLYARASDGLRHQATLESNAQVAARYRAKAMEYGTRANTLGLAAQIHDGGGTFRA
jgi:hypothetical protein